MISYLLPSISVQAKCMAQEVQNEPADLERDNGVHKLQLCFVHPESAFLRPRMSILVYFERFHMEE